MNWNKAGVLVAMFGIAISTALGWMQYSSSTNKATSDNPLVLIQPNTVERPTNDLKSYSQVISTLVEPIKAENQASVQDEAIIKSLITVHSYIENGIDHEPLPYLSLLSNVKSELLTYKGQNISLAEHAGNTYACYAEAAEIWKDGSPSAMINKGISSLYYDAQIAFRYKTLPVLGKKWQECIESLNLAYMHYRG